MTEENWSAYDDEALLRTEQVACWLKLSLSKLNKARMNIGDGPAFVKVGESVRYQVGDVKRWITENRRRSVRVQFIKKLSFDEWGVDEGEAEQWLTG